MGQGSMILLQENDVQKSITFYGYVFNDPIKHNDTDGRFTLFSNLDGAAAGEVFLTSGG